MSTSQATENNQRLFRRYAKMFALNDPDIYISHAEKLSLWLNDFKAYYATARPEIVKLLLIAQMTLRRALGRPEHLNSPFNVSGCSQHPMAKSYIKLVKVVEPFENYFTEPGLSAHVRSLIASVSPPPAPDGVQTPITHFQPDIQIQTHAPETLPLPSHLSETQIILPSSDTTVPPVLVVLPVAAKAQIKVKKRKAVDFDLLVQRDIKALLEKQGNQGNQGHSSQHITEDRALVSPSSLGLGDSPPFKKANSVVETHLSTRAARQEQNMVAPDQTTESLPLWQDPSVTNDVQKTPLPARESQKTTVLDQNIEPPPAQDTSVSEGFQRTPSPSCEDQNMATPDRVAESLPCQDTGVSAKVQKIFSSAPIAEDREMAPPDSVGESSTLRKASELRDYSSQTEDQEIDTAEPPLLSKDVDVAIVPQVPSWRHLTQEQERQEMAVVDSGDSGPLPPQRISISLETQESAAMLIDEETVTPFLQPSLRSQTRNVAVPVSNDHLGNILPAQDVRPLIPPVSTDDCSVRSLAGKFGQEMRIVAVGKGLRKQCTMTFTCDISSTVFPKVSAWLNRNIFSLNIEQSLCLSLGCYSITDLQEQSTKNRCTTLEQQTSVARSHWPQKGGLSMNVQFQNAREDLPLSPPFQVTPDGFVDVSQFLFTGKNVIKLQQTTDMSQYIFVLHSHFPTRAQLHEVDGRQQRDREWQEWVRHVSRPFDIPLKPVLQT